MLGLGAEATAAIVGAGVGGGIGLFAQLAVLGFLGRRQRRAAAQLIFAELLTARAEAELATELGEWPSTSGLPTRTAWETYGVKLAGGRGIKRLAHIAFAYSMLDDLAWLAQKGSLSKDADYSQDLLSIRLGLAEVGATAGFSAHELENRNILDDEIRKERKKLETAYQRSKRRSE